MAINWNLYQKKLNLNGNDIRERQINLMKDSVKNDFANSPSFRNAYINDSTSETGIHVIDNKNASTKKVVMQPNDNINVGDLFSFDNNKWLCVDADKINPVQQSGIVSLCNNTIQLHENGVLFNIPVVTSTNISVYSMGVEDNKYFSVNDDELILITSNDENTMLIKTDDVYQIGMRSYKVQSIQDVITPGLLYIKTKVTTEVPEPIPSPTPVQDIIILGSDSMIKGKSAVYTVDYADDVVFSVDNALVNITNQSNNQCVLQAGNTLGSVRLTAKTLDGSAEGYKDIRIKNIF